MVYFKPKAKTFFRNAFAFGCITVSTLILPACQDDVTVSVVERRKLATVYSPGSKITVVPADQSEVEMIPPSLLDPSKICSSVKFYNADGNIGYGEADCSGASVADLKPENIRAGAVVGEIVGTLTPGPANCSVDGETACVATADFRAAQVDSLPSKIAIGSTAAGIAGTFVGNFNACTADGEVGCLANGTFKAASITGVADKILAGQTIAGVTGSASLPPASKVLTGTIYGPAGNAVGGSLTLPSAGNVRAGSGLYGESGTSVTPAYVADFPDVANVLGSDTVNGAAGTLTLPLAANVRTVNGAYGVGGSSTSPTLSTCGSDGDTGCVIVGPTYAAAIVTGAASRIVSGQSVAGVSGSFTAPAVGKVLIGTAYGSGGNGSTGTLTLPSAGNVLTGSGTYGDPGSALTPSYSPDYPSAGNVLSTDTVNGATGTLTLPAVGNVLSTISFGVGGNGSTGTLVLPAAGKVLTATFYGVAGSGSTGTLTLPAAGNVLTGSGTFGDPGAAVTPALSPDFPAASHVLSTDTVNGATGTLTLPAAGKVLTGTSYGVSGSSSTGTLTLPAAVDVLSGSGTYGDPGTPVTPTFSPDFPAVGNVLSTDTVNGAAGTLTLPATGNVLSGSGTYGNPGAALTPSYTPDFPAVSNVLSADTVNGAAGTLTLPAVGNVLTGISFGAGGNGSTGTLTLPTAANVRTSSGVFGVGGNGTTPTLATCSAEGEAGCVVVGPAYAAAVITGAADKLLSGQSLGGVSGNITLPAVGKVLTGTSFGVAGTGSTGTLSLPAAANVLSGSGTYGDPGSALTPSYSPDYPSAGNVLSTDTVNGAAGTLTLPAAGKVLTATSYGVAGSGSTGTLTLPAADDVLTGSGTYGDPGAAVTPTFSPDYPSAGNVLSTDTVNGAAGTLTLPAVGNVLSTISFGVAGNGSTGTLVLPAAGKVLTATSYGVAGTGSTGTLTLPSVGNVLIGSGTYGDPGSALIPSYSPDFPSVGNVLSTDTVNGAAGTLTLPAVGNVRVSNGAYGAGGNGSTPTLSDCSAANQSSCVATSVYPTMNLTSVGTATGLTSTNFNTTIATNASFEFWDAAGARHSVAGDNDLSVGNLKSGAVIFGVTGQYPSASYLLAANTVATDLTLFNTQLTTDGSFEFFDSAGARYTGSGDSDIINANVKGSIQFENLSITGSAPTPACSYSTQATCTADSACTWNGSSCSLNSWNIRIGTTIGGVGGSLKTSCRNRATTTIYNSDTMPPGNAAISSGTTVHWWDTIDDFSNDAAFPTTLVAAWNTNTDCDSNVWQDLTADGACNAATDDCILSDRITNLQWSESYPVTGQAPTYNYSKSWSAAVDHCNSLSYGSYTDWRLPTQKELMEAYVHGIRNVGYTQSNTIRPSGNTLVNNDQFIIDTDNYFWSSTSASDGSANAWVVGFNYGYNFYGASTAKTSTSSFLFLCVRPGG